MGSLHVDEVHALRRGLRDVPPFLPTGHESSNMSEESLSPGAQLREVIRTSAIQVPGAPNALAARMIEDAGFEALYLSGAAFSAGVMALPDVGLFTLTELVQQVNYFTARVAIPVVVDADTGFGEAVNVERTVAELERAGAAAIQLEDQVLPKRCGHLSGKTLVEADAMCAKLRAAVSARVDVDTVIIARTDARASEGFDAAVARARRYLDAGADWIFPEALTNPDEFEKFADAVDAPLMANMTEFGKSPLLEFNELADLGYKVVIYPVTLLRVAMKAIETTLTILAEDGTQKELLDLMQTRQELYDLLDYEGYESRDREHFA
jgi:methylisocitrate lyase